MCTFQILQNFKIFQSKTRSLGCRTVFLRKKWLSCKILQDEWLCFKILARRTVILQHLARFRKKILQDDVSSCKIRARSCKITDGYLERFLQDGWLSCKILARRMVILQDLARFWKITIRIRLGKPHIC